MNPNNETPILDKLNELFAISISEDTTIATFFDTIDYYINVNITKTELLTLVKELQQIAKTMKEKS